MQRATWEYQQEIEQLMRELGIEPTKENILNTRMIYTQAQRDLLKQQLERKN